MNEIKAKNTLRVIAVSTQDELIREFALDLLNETLNEAKEELKNTCWLEDLDDIRNAIKRNLRHSMGLTRCGSAAAGADPKVITNS